MNDATGALPAGQDGAGRFGPVVEQFQKQNPIQMHDDEIEFIVRTIRQTSSDSLMVEWGSGGSTVRWLQEMSGAQNLISIEHNFRWYRKVRSVVDSSESLSRRLEYLLRPPNGAWKHGYGGVEEESPVGLEGYFAPTDRIFDADTFLIDGVARGVCAILVQLRSRRDNPTILLHDWYPRQNWYSWALQLYPRIEQVGTTLVQLFKQ